MGVTDPGLLGITVGTSGVVVMAETQPLFGSFCHAVSDRWLLLNSMHAAGLSLSWFRENLVPDVSYEDLMHLAAQAPAGCSNLIFLPFLLGERDTGRHSLSACYYGLTPQHGRTYLVRALVEGVTFELRRMCDLWTEQGLVADQVHLSGGASRNELWRTIMAAVLNLAIERMDRDASFGAALLAGVGAGWWNSPEEGYLATRPAGRHEMPEPVLVEQYAHIYTRYLALYRLLSAAAAHGDLDDVG
jgi:xylulokinase